jgi:hypothetical protein
MNITGSIDASNQQVSLESFGETHPTVSGAFNAIMGRQNPTADGSGLGTMMRGFSFDASKAWTGETSSNGAHTHTVTASASNAGAHTHTITGSNANNGAHTHTITGSNATNGAHTHTISGSNTSAGTHTHTWSGSIGNNGTHNHTISVVANGNHTHTVGNTGSGLPVNTLPPYQTVYMWRRTA